MTDLPMAHSPGKFEGELDLTRKIHELCGDSSWLDEEESIEGGGWYGLLALKSDEDFADWTGITADEAAYLKSRSGLILYEDEQGFVWGTYYCSREDLDAAWAHVQVHADRAYALQRTGIEFREV